MSTPNHIIKRQVIEVDVPSVESGWKIQNRFSELYKSELMHILDDVFSSIAGPGEILRIDKLELDLGKFKTAAFEEEVALKLRTLLQEKLTEVRQKTISGELNSPIEESITNARSVRYTSSDFLVHFLKTGTAPWWYNKERFGTVASVVDEIIAERPQWLRTRLKLLLRQDDVRARLVSHLDNKQLTAFLNVFSSTLAQTSGKIIITLSDQIRKIKTGTGFSSATFRTLFWNALLAKIVNEKQDELVALFSRKEVVKVVKLLAKKERALKEFVVLTDLKDVIRLDEKTTKRVSKKSSKNTHKSEQEESDEFYMNSADEISEFEEEFMNENTSETAQPDHDISESEKSSEKGKKKKRLVKKSRNKKKLKSADESVDPENKKLFSGKNVSDKESQDDSTELISGDSDEKVNDKIKEPQSEEMELSTLKKKDNAQPNRVEEGEEFEEYDSFEVNEEDLADFTIENAGLVILWPYLNPFFTEVGLVENKKFVSEAAAARAVHLLHFLATGVLSDYEEHELVLNKLMCGLDVTAVIDMQFEITNQEKEEAENLLQALITNWKAIGSTSLNGFRGTFLLKEGALKKDDQGWRLYIERKTVDMLLDRLPWGISLVKLPWSGDIIYVEW